MLGITDYLWRLIPANPILLRVIETGGKRRRDLFIRCGYLGILVFYVTFSLFSGSGDAAGLDLAKLASTSASIFQKMSYLQLALVALIAPIFTAGAITQEKDSQTYDILLSTPLTNGQIVLGSLLSRLFFVIALLISGIPIFAVTQIFGGVAIRAIVQSFSIAAATAFVTGALAMAIATLKVGTRRTIFSFYLFIVIYLVGGFLLDQLAFFKISLVDPMGKPSGELSKTSWLTGIHPFLALRTIMFDRSYLPPELTELPSHLRIWPFGWYLSRPASFFITSMFGLSFVLVIPSIILLRRLAQSTVSYRSWFLQLLRISSGDRTRKPRSVWSNPIAWREAKTKASAARAAVLRYSFMAAGTIGAIVLCVMYATKLPVAKYVDESSYNSDASTLSIYSESEAKTYKISLGAQVYVNDRPASINHIRGKYMVRQQEDINTTDRGSTINSIKLWSIPSRLSAADARKFVLGMIIVEFSVILLIVTNAAASTVTREKEDGTLDLLLSTPITSRYYIWGKLRGLVSYILPLVAVPAISVAIFILYDIFQGIFGSSTADWIVLPESIVILPATFTIVAAFAAILGMQMSLRCRTTVMAVMSSVGIVVGICGTLGWCGWNLLSGSSGIVSVILGSFSPFTVLTLLIDPKNFFGSMNDSDEQFRAARIAMVVCSLIALAAYTAVVWAMYTSMVKNFDMTIRRQSR